MSIRLLHVTHKPPYPIQDGGCYALAELAHILQEQPIGYYLTSFSTQKHPFELSEQAADLQKHCTHPLNLNTKASKRKGLLSMLKKTEFSFLLERFFNKQALIELEETILQNKITHVVFDGLATAVYLPALQSKYPKVSYIYRAHNVENQIWKELATKESKSLKRLFLSKMQRDLEAFEKKVWKLASQCWCISSADLKEIEKLNLNTKLLPFSIAQEFAVHPTKKANAKAVVGYLGALDWLPNRNSLQWFVEEVWENHHLHEIAQLKIAGKSPVAMPWLKNKKEVSYLGFVVNSVQFMQELDVFVAPLFEGSGIRVKIIEALSEKLPILTTKKGIQGLDVEDGKQVFLAASATEFAKRLKTLCSDEKKREALSEAGFQYFEQNHARKLISSQFLAKYLED